jgi:hypothetical protein
LTIHQLKTNIRRKLLSIDSATPTDNGFIRMRCQFCGDSKKDINKKRLYIKIDENNDNEPMWYYCHNCEAHGLITPSILRTFKIHDMDLNSELYTYNTTIEKTSKRTMYNKYNNISFSIPHPKNTKANIMKKKYIENRLGINLPVAELIRLKTIFSFDQFIKENNIDSITCKNGLKYYIDKDYVGFLTANNEFINFRDITNKNKMRYYKYSILQNPINTLKFYTIPTSINIMSTETININLAEGVFDILGIYFHILNQNNENNVYAAVCGSAYNTVIKYFIKLGIFGKNVVINIFADSDKPPSEYSKVKKDFSMFCGEIKLFYNQLNKDCGTIKENIKLIEKRIP